MVHEGGFFWGEGGGGGVGVVYLAHITLARKKDPFYIHIKNSVPPKDI